MDLALTDKVVFITGASGGIGRALASGFAAEGARLALHGRSQVDGLRAWVAEQDWSERARVVAADVRDPGQLDSVVDEIASLWGRVDVAIANAGVWKPPDLPLHETPIERVREVIDTNLLGATWTARAFLRALAASGPRPDGHGASLVFIGSTAGRYGEAGHAEYAASKAGLIGLMRSLKNEIVTLDPAARVNVVEPGWTVTHMARPALQQSGLIARVVATMPLRQIGRASDIGHAVVWLSSPTASRHVSGQTLTVAGGMEGRLLWPTEQTDEDAIRSRVTDGP